MAIFHTAHLRVREDIVEQFRERLLRHARISRDAEAGCHRFDIHQEAKDPGLFLLIEIYADEAAFELHRAFAALSAIQGRCEGLGCRA